MPLQESILAIFRAPTPAKLRNLRGDLLQAGFEDISPLWSHLESFNEFLNQLCASMSAHEYSKLATMLDIGAVGGVALENILESNLDPADLWRKFLVGGLSEGLMVLASRQYVKAFQAETSSVYAVAGWHLYQSLWRFSVQAQPDLSPAGRRKALDQLLAPVHEDNVSGVLKAILIGRLYQVVLLLYLAGSLQGIEAG